MECGFRRGIDVMKKPIILLMCLAGSLATSCVALGETSEQFRAQAALSKLEQRLLTGEIQRVRIVGIPFSASFDPEVTEESLDRYPYYRCETQVGQTEYGSIARLVSDTRVTGEHMAPDVRWGVVFYDGNGNRVSSIYTAEDFSERSFVDAKIDGYVATINKPLIDWLVAHVPFAGCVKEQGLADR
jgi:hypothetical protein